MAASLRDPGSIPGGGPKRFHDSFNFVFYIVGECISSAADTHLATDLTDYIYSFHRGLPQDCPSPLVLGLGSGLCPLATCSKTESLCHLCGKGLSGAAIRDIGYQLDSQWDSSHPTFNLSLIV